MEKLVASNTKNSHTKQLVSEVFWSLHREFGKHPGIIKTIFALREKYFDSNMAQLISEWVMSCKQCLTESRINRRLTCPPLKNPKEYITAPEDTMQIDLLPELPLSGGYENIVTAMDVSSRFLFAYPTSNQEAITIAKNIINIMTKHASLPTALISDKGRAFMSHVIKEVAGVLSITLKQATTKNAQTIGLLERSHASIKQPLKIETGERRSMLQKYVSNAVLNYSTSYQASLGCDQSKVFHGRTPYNVLDSKMGVRPQKNPTPDSQIDQDMLEQTEIIFQDVRKNAMQVYIKNKAIMIKKQVAQNSNHQNTFTSYSPKRITKEANFPLQIFGGLDLIFLKGVAEQLFGTQNWHQKTASVSTNEAGPIHTPPTDTRYTNHNT